MRLHYQSRVVPFISANKARIIHSLSYNPWYNLALEEYLLARQAGERVLYLWQNQRTIVIGRNQNAWKECRCQLLEAEEGKLARRLSGGGAVYHDLGNLNFTFIMDKTVFDLEKQLEVILEAVQDLGIDACFSGRNDLLAAGKKFSGNAFYYGNTAALHHGTILINTNVQKMGAYLQVSKEKIRSKGVDSVPSRVVNLITLKPGITVESLKKALEESFYRNYQGQQEKTVLDPESLVVLQPLYNKYASWDWRYGQAPECDFTINHRFSWGELELGLQLTEGKIRKALAFSDALEVSLIENLAAVLEGVSFHPEEVLQAVAAVPLAAQNQVMLEEIKEWLSRELADI